MFFTVWVVFLQILELNFLPNSVADLSIISINIEIWESVPQLKK